MRLLAALLPFLLGACAQVSGLVNPPYVPEPIHVFDQAQYDADVMECAAAGANFKPHFSVGGAVSKTLDGATSNTSLIPINPLVPAFGALGGAIQATSDGLDVMSGQHNNVFRNCLRDETRRDRSAIVADPRE